MAVFLHKVHDPSRSSVCPLPPEPVAPPAGIDADALDEEGEPCLVSVALRHGRSKGWAQRRRERGKTWPQHRHGRSQGRPKLGHNRLSQAAHLHLAPGEPLTAS